MDDLQKGSVSSFLESITVLIDYDAARTLVNGKTEKQGGVNPVRQIDAGDVNNSVYRIGNIPLDMFRENEFNNRYDGTVNEFMAIEYSQRSTNNIPPVIAVLSKKTGKLNILDGGHRLSAARIRGDTSIYTIISFKQ